MQQQLEQLNADTDLVLLGRFVIAMGEGRPADALAALQGLSAIDIVRMAWQAGALAQAGQLEEAFARLEEALDAGYRDAADLRNSRWYEPLRKARASRRSSRSTGSGPRNAPSLRAP